VDHVTERLVAQALAEGVDLVGPNGVLRQLSKLGRRIERWWSRISCLGATPPLAAGEIGSDGMPQLSANGVTLDVMDEGDGPAVLMLHGFPDSARVWRLQVPRLVAAGFRVIAPDLRGFGNSARPEEVEEYRLSVVLRDMTVLLDAYGLGRVHVVGHDWGGTVAWLLAALRPERVDRLAVLSVPHPGVRRRIEQREKSWYMLLFQFRGVAEDLLQRDDWRLFRDFLRGDGDLDNYLADFRRPGALTAALNWYRANADPARELRSGLRPPRVTARTLGIWSSRDSYLLEAPMVESGSYVTGGWRYERIENASHWMQLDAPDELSRLLVDFLSEQ
jgi:pimeloyl-ACP methyl ester carboxylesterase